MLCCGRTFLSFPDMQDNRQEAGSKFLFFNLHQHSINPRLTPPDGGTHGFAIHALVGARLFHILFSYGIFLPFWSVWLKGIGLTQKPSACYWGRVWLPVSSGVSHRAPRQRSFPPDFRLARAGLLTLLFAVAFWAGAHVAWLIW